MDKQIRVIISATDNATWWIKKLWSSIADFWKKNEATFQKMRNIGAVALSAIAFSAKWMVDSFADAEAQMVKVDWILKTLWNETIKKAWWSLEVLKWKIEAVSQANIKLWFDDEDTATSLAKLTSATGDYWKALELNNLAMDLARYKWIWLAEATDVMVKIQAWQTRVLKELWIEVKEWTTAQEAYAIVMQKTAWQAQWYAQTVAWWNEIMNVSMWNLKETIGASLAPAFQKLVATIQPLIARFTEWATNNSDLLAKIILVVGAIMWLVTALWTLWLILPAISTAITAISVVIWALSLPVVLVIAAIVAWWIAIKELVEGRDLMIATFKRQFQWLIDSLIEMFTNLQTRFSDLRNNVKQIFIDGWESIKNWVLWIIDSFTSWVKTKLSWILEFAQSVIKTIVGVVNSAKELAWTVWNWISNGVQAVWNLITWKRALWGTIRAWKSYLVWEDWPEVINPSTTSNVSQPWWKSMSVNINLPSVIINNAQDENRLIQMMKNAFIEEAKNFNLWIIV